MSKIVITGCASGIGREVTQKLLAAGHEIIGIDLRDADIIADLSTLEGRKKAISDTLEKTGSEIDILITAAGMGGHLPDGKLVMIVNYFGTVELLDGFFPAMKGRPGAVALALSSNSAQMGVDPENELVKALLAHDEQAAVDIVGDAPSAGTYGLSKHAVARAVRHRAHEWGTAGVRLNAIAPGMTETPMLQGVRDNPDLKGALEAIPVPLNRTANVDEIANVIVLMVSDAFSFMHGSVLYVDGGTDAVVRPNQF